MGGIYPKPPPPPAFTLKGDRFDQSTFEGRWMQFQQSTDVRTLFYGDQHISNALKIIQEYKEAKEAEKTGGHNNNNNNNNNNNIGSSSKYTDDQLWDARRVVEATCHPETNEPITPPFRFAAFAPANIPICVLLLWPNPSPAMAIFGQWVNQSYNVAVNYKNRNMSNPMPMNVVGASYGLAVGTSCGLAVGLGQYMKKRGGAITPFTRAVVPWTGVVVAGCVNVAFVRWKELTEGIDVKSEDGEITYGKSIKAGQSAIGKCCVARAIWTTPVVGLAPFLVAPIHRMFPHPRAKMLSEIAVLAGCLWAVMPAALAVFPQKDSMLITDLEPELQEKIQKMGGNPGNRVFYNKGL
jgi:tricarboxylate carrier